MGLYSSAYLVWGVPVTSEDYPAYDEEIGWPDGLEHLEFLQHGRFGDSEARAILTIKGVPQFHVFEARDVTTISSDAFFYRPWPHEAYNAERERAEKFRDLPSLRDGKWCLVVSYG